MSGSEIRKLCALLIGFLAALITTGAVFSLSMSAEYDAVIRWIVISAASGAIAGVLYQPKRFVRNLILWPAVVAGGPLGLGLYLYGRSQFFPLSVIFHLEIAVGFLAGIFPGLLLAKYWE